MPAIETIEKFFWIVLLLFLFVYISKALWDLGREKISPSAILKIIGKTLLLGLILYVARYLWIFGTVLGFLSDDPGTKGFAFLQAFLSFWATGFPIMIVISFFLHSFVKKIKWFWVPIGYFIICILLLCLFAISNMIF